jgi:hypothetical protein
MDAGSTRRTRPSLGRWALLILALVPFGTAVAAHLRGPTGQPASTRRDTPPVVFDQYLVDLGETVEQSLVFGWFRFHNRSDRPIRVQRLLPSCGCLQPQLRQHEYAPGETGEFYVRVQTANESSGRHEYTVGFEYETLADEGASVESEPRLETLSFRVTLPERKVTVEPKGLAFYQLDGRETTREIFVRDFREPPAGGERLRLLDVRCASPLVKVAVGETVDEAAHRKHEIRVTVSGDVPAGTHWETIEIHTDDATYPILRVPLQLRGPEGGIQPVGGERPAP